MLSLLLAFTLASGAGAPSQQADFTEATEWVRLVDAERWDDSWAAAGAFFKSQITQDRWASAVAPVRKPLGEVSSRVLQSVTKTQTLPGAPDGVYEVLEFHTRFANKASATETVVLTRETTGWKVVGYFIK